MGNVIKFSICTSYKKNPSRYMRWALVLAYY